MKNLKLFAIGALSGAIVLSSVNYYNGKIVKHKQETSVFEDKFGVPDLSYSPEKQEKKIEKKYSFDYYGETISFQNENLETWGFDSQGNPYKLDLEEVEVDNTLNALLEPNYLTELEYNVYNSILNKDRIINQYNVYILFNSINQLYEQYLNRKDFVGKENRMNYLYNLCISYIHPDSNYTFAKLKYKELDKTIQEDIEKDIINLKYMKDNGKVKEESKLDQLADDFSKTLNYGILKKGK